MFEVQHNNQRAVLKKKEVSFLSNMLSQDGFYLKNILAFNSLGYCSVDIITIESLFKKYSTEVWVCFENPFFGFNKNVVNIAKSIAQRSSDQHELLVALTNNRFGHALNIFYKNSYVLYTYEGERFFDLISRVFAGKFTAISENSIAYGTMRQLLHKGFDLDALDNDGRSLLCKVIMATNKKKYRDVLKGGVGVNLLDYRGKSALYYAILLGDEDKVRALLQYGAVVHQYMAVNGLSRSLRCILNNAFNEQKCIKCCQHPFNMSNIPCINRHMGHFICKYCYDFSRKCCPLCRRALDEYGR